MVVQTKESCQAIAFKPELDLEQQPQIAFLSFTYLRKTTCTIPNQRHKLRRLLW